MLVLHTLIAALLWPIQFLYSCLQICGPFNDCNQNTENFKLSHVFLHELGTSEQSGHFHSLSAHAAPWTPTIARDSARKQNGLITIRSRPMLLSRRKADDAEVWEDDQVLGPDVGDKETVVNLAKMCSDAYVFTPSDPEWLNNTLGFNQSHAFGWKGDGLRGQVFADEKNETVIVAFKGTSIEFFDRGSNKDRLNDNLLFSCCCASQSFFPFWHPPVCGCRSGHFQCNSTCLTKELMRKDRYYSTALAVMHNVTSWYPNASIWAIGHSLGGSIASLMGLTFNIPSVSYEAPPQRLAAQRLGLEIPPHTGAHHFGNSADPIYMGACNGCFSSCSIAGYAFESQCHTGKRCIYDTVGDKGWHMSIFNHRLVVVIPEVLEAYTKPPACEAEYECVDCYNWDYHP